MHTCISPVFLSACLYVYVNVCYMYTNGHEIELPVLGAQMPDVDA